MTQKDKEKNLKIILIVALAMLATGGFVALVGAAEYGLLDNLRDDDYLSNPDIKYSELENATYEYSADDLELLTVNALIIVIIGGTACIVGYVVLLCASYALPSKAEKHLAYCPTLLTSYCPECGISSKKLDEYELNRQLKRLRNPGTFK
jgi:hypothetical protein